MIDPTGVLLSATFAGVVAIGATVAVERWGGRAGGLLGTLPTTIVPAAIGIAAGSPDPSAFQDAMFATPAGMLVNALFLWTWRVLPPRLHGEGVAGRLGLMVAASLSVWGVAAALSVAALTAVARAPLPRGALAVTLTVALVAVGALACRRAPPSPKGGRAVRLPALLSRGVLAAAAIGAAVALASVGGPLAAGMAAVFPAIFLTTMVSLWLSQGEAVQVGAVGPMMLGSGSVSAFAVVAAWAVPVWGIGLGAAAAWAAAVGLVTVPAWWWLGRGREQR